MNACPIIDHITRPFVRCSVPNDESSELCATDSWIDEGWKHVASTLLKLSAVFRIFTRGPIIDRFGRSLILYGLGFAVPSIEVC